MLEPIFKPIDLTELGRQKPSEAVSVFTTLLCPLKPRFSCPLILTTSYVDEKGVKHEYETTWEPDDPSYNLEKKQSKGLVEEVRVIDFQIQHRK